MTNKEAIKQLRPILDTEREWKEYYATRLPARVWQRRFKKQSVRVAALEHAIMELAGGGKR